MLMFNVCCVRATLQCDRMLIFVCCAKLPKYAVLHAPAIDLTGDTISKQYGVECCAAARLLIRLDHL